MRLGKYEQLCELASGGMGTVHVARQVGDVGFSRLVVLKLLHAHLKTEAEFRNMIRDEAALASQIRHPNVVPVLDVVEQDDEICLVLEYVPSVPLSVLTRAAVEKGEVIEPAIASRVLSDVLGGLHAAHELRDLSGKPLQVVHRDISPQNVLVGADGCARLIDFGIAKAAVRYARTKSGDLKGKISFLSPEQLQRKEVDRRADIFAAGAVLYETLSGKPLFEGSDEGSILLQILMGKSKSLAALGLSAEVDALIRHATEKAREQRFATARDFEEALTKVIVPASTHEVAATVERLCGEMIRERRNLIRTRVDDVERRDALAPTNANEPKERRSLRAPIAAGAVVALLAGGAFATRGQWSAKRTEAPSVVTALPDPLPHAAVSSAPVLSVPTSEPAPTNAPPSPSIASATAAIRLRPSASAHAPKSEHPSRGGLKENPWEKDKDKR